MIIIYNPRLAKVKAKLGPIKIIITHQLFSYTCGNIILQVEINTRNHGFYSFYSLAHTTIKKRLACDS